MNVRTRRFFWALVAILTAASIFAVACGDDEGDGTPSRTAAASATAAAAFPVTITDSNGDEVTLEAAPERIVALAPSFVEVLFAIGAEGSLAAVDENSDYPPEAADVPKVSGFQPNLEAIAGMEADLVLLAFPDAELQQALEGVDIPSLYLGTPEDVDEVLEQMRLLGQITGQSAEAEDVIADMEARIEAVEEKLSAVTEGPRVFHELDPTGFTTCPGEFIHDMYVVLKAENIAGEISGLCQMTQEAVIAADPDVIILADEPAGVTVQSVKDRAGWENISAVTGDRIHLVDADVVSRPGPRVADAIETLAALLYPDEY